MNLLLIQCDYNGIISKCVKQWIEIVRQKKDGTPANSKCYIDTSNDNNISPDGISSRIWEYIQSVQKKIKELGDIVDYSFMPVVIETNANKDEVEKMINNISNCIESYIDASDLAGYFKVIKLETRKLPDDYKVPGKNILAVSRDDITREVENQIEKQRGSII